MLTPSDELGVFLAQAMYGELEKIAKFRVAGGGALNSLTSIAELLDDVAPIRPSSMHGFGGQTFNRIFRPNQGPEARRQTIARGKRALSDFEFQLKSDLKSEDPKIKSDALKASREAQKLRTRIRTMEQGRFTDAPAPNRRVEPDPTAAASTKPKKKSEMGGFDRFSSGVGKATLGVGGLGLLGAGALQYRQGGQQGMPY
jgi:hypothetical protein